MQNVYLGNLSDTDRTIARVVQWLSIVLLVGLAVTGIWQFFFHEASNSWSRFELGSDRYFPAPRSTGIAEFHAGLADLAGLFTLFVLAWLSSRVLHRISWFAIGTLVLIIASLYTGTLIRFNAIIESQTVVTDTRGYGQLVWGSADGVVTDRFELDRLAIVLWTLAHVVSIPVLVLAASITLKRAEGRRVLRKGERPSWLDTLATSESSSAAGPTS